MRQSKLFTKTFKEVSKDETSFNAKMLIKAGFIDKLAAGIYTFLPLGLRTHNKVCNIIREEMDSIDGQEMAMPALHPKKVWEKTGRWKDFDVLFKFKLANEKEYALGPTHEEVVTPLVKKHVFSYKDLPIAVYHIQTKFRNELRAKAGLLRGREFPMKDLYSFHRDKKDLDNYYEKVKEAYFKIFKRCGLKNVYLTYASGGAFSKYSHEFQALAEKGEDTIYLCQECSVGVNEEIIKEQDCCPLCKNKKLKKEKAIEIGNIFKLGTRFSKPFDLSYIDQKGKKKDVEMGCYGIGTGRLMGTIVETNFDKKGIIWPDLVAPYQIHLVCLDNGKEKVSKAADEIYQTLSDNKLEVFYDDRKDKSPGEKFADADLIGLPVRLVVSSKTIEKNSVEFKERGKEKTELMKIEEVILRLKD